MWEFLSDPVWQGIGAVIGLAGVVSAIILGLLLYLLQRRRKRLGFRVLAESRVVSVESEVAEEVVIVFKGEVVRDVHLVLVELVNYGNQPIVPDDYQRPLSVDLGEGARVLSVEEAGSEPEGIASSPCITESRETVEMEPALLNAGDSLRLKILVSGFGGAIGVEGRVVGVTEIAMLREEPSKARVALVALIGLPVMAMLAWGAPRMVEALLQGLALNFIVWVALIMSMAALWVQAMVPALNRFLRS